MEDIFWGDVTRYLSHLENELAASPNTISAYRNDLNGLCSYLATAPSRNDDLSEPPVASAVGGWGSVTHARLIGFVVKMKENRYATTTIARKIAAIKSFFKFLETTGVIASDPSESLDSPHINKVVPKGLSSSEVTGLLDENQTGTSPDDIRDNAMLRLLYSSGLRVSELVSLNVEDLDLSSGYVRCIARTGRERIIPLDDVAIASLQTYLEASRAALIRHREEVALFVNRRGDRLTRQGFWLILRERARAAGLPESVTPQSLRHSYAIRLLHDNTDLADVQKLLGHANITTTQIYSQSSDKNVESNPISALRTK